MLHDQVGGTVAAVLKVQPRGFVLDDAGIQQQRVDGWSRLLASLCQQHDVIRAQLVIRTVAAGLHETRRWWNDQRTRTDSWANEVASGLLDDLEWGATRRECLLVLAVRPARSGKRLSDASIASCEQRLASVADAAEAADMVVEGWVPTPQIPALVRGSFEPHVSPAGPRPLGSSDAPLGPVAVEEKWDRARTDSAWHATYWVAEWPRSEVASDFLQPLLAPDGHWWTFSLTVEPVSTGRALRDIRRAKVEHAADASQRERVGRVEDETTRAEIEDVARREQDLVAGHGELRFVGLLSGSAPGSAELDETCAALESAAARAMCEVRRLYGQQAQAHAVAAVPVAGALS